MGLTKRKLHLVNTIFLSFSFIFLLLVSPSPAAAAEQQVQVIIQPQGAVDAGAKWRVKGWALWFESGSTQEVPYGEVEIEFRDTDTGDWITPANHTINVTEDKTYTYTAEYTLPYGELTVNIQTQEALNDDAWWQVNGAGTRFSSGETIRLNQGRYDIVFSPVRGLIRPQLSVRIEAGRSITRNVQYVPLIVGRVKIKADNMVLTGNAFKASGKVRLIFPEETSAPDRTLIALSGTAVGTLVPPVIRSTGSVSVNRSGYSIALFGTSSFYNGYFSLDALKLKATNLSFLSGTEFLGLKIKVRNFRFLLNPFGVSMRCSLKLDEKIFGIDGTLNIRRLDLLAGETWPRADYTIKSSGYNMFDFIACENITATGNAFENKIECHVDRLIIPYLPSIEADFLLKGGVLKNLSAEIKDADKQIKNTPFYLQDLTLNLKNVTVKQGQLIIGLAGTLLPQDYAVAGLDMELLIDFEGYAEGTGQINVLGYRTTEGNLVLYVPGFIMGDFYKSILFGLKKFYGSFTGTWADGEMTSFIGNGSGTVSFDPPDWAVPLLGDLVADDGYVYVLNCFVSIGTSGYLASVKLLNLVNLSFFLPPKWLNNGTGLQMQPLDSRTLTRTVAGGSTASSQAFEVPAGSPGVVFSGIGEQGTPAVALIRPDGGRIDPAGDMPENSHNFIYRSDPESKTTAVLVRSPQAGYWTVEVTNPAEAGETELVFYKGNHTPRFNPVKLTKIEDKNFHLDYTCFDPDNDAEISFYLDDNNWGFNGIPIGTKKEKDGKGFFAWRPEEISLKSGYIYAVVDDGMNQPQAAYFQDKVYVVESFLEPPELRDVISRGNRLIIKLGLDHSEAVDHLRVYYSDDLEADVIHDWLNFQTDPVIRIKDGPVKPGRPYRIAVSAIDIYGAETRLSDKMTVAYEASNLNNHPFISSEPGTEALAGEKFIYAFAAEDWDSDPLLFALKEGPDGMALDPEEDRLIWTPKAADVGRNRVILNVRDGQGGEDDQTFFVEVSSAANQAVNASAEWITAPSGRQLFIEAVDMKADLDPSIQDALEVTVKDEYGAELGRLTLLETSARSGVFHGIYADGDIPYAVHALLDFQSASKPETRLTLEWTDRSRKVPVTGGRR
jgi:hypothetical protein